MADTGEQTKSPVLCRDGESQPDNSVKFIISPLALVPADLIRVLTDLRLVAAAFPCEFVCVPKPVGGEFVISPEFG